MFKPEQIQKVIAPQAAQVIKMPLQLGSRVQQGEQLIELDVPDLESRIKRAKARLETLAQQFGSAGFNAKLTGQQPILKERLSLAQQELDGLLDEQKNLAQKALFSGTIVDADPDLFLGEWVAKSSALVILINDKDWVVDCYVEEADLQRIEKGNWGRFVADAPGVGAVNLTVVDIDKDATRVMTEGVLTSVAGGEILVRPQQNKLIPERAVYRVRLKVDGTEKLSTGYIRGRVAIYGWPKSILGEFIRLGLASVWRETGF
jgi:putative peptide zinc metalloprotease protein